MQKQNESDLVYEDESYKIRGACFKVYNVLGGGIKEKIIERALCQELISSGFNAQKEVRINIYYKNQKIGTYIPDIVVDKKIMIEIKSKPFITKEDLKQFWGYLKGSEYQLGFLVGFTPKALVIKIFIYTNKVNTKSA